MRMSCLLVIVLGPLVGLMTTTGQSAEKDKPAKATPEGIWQGTIKVGEVEVRLVFHIKKKDDKLMGTMDSPDQGAKGIALDSVEFKHGTLRVELKKAKASFEGKVNKELTTIDGKWKQAGSSFPLKLERSKTAPTVKRPQTPRKPYPYREEEVTFKNPKDDVKFAGTLTLPKAKGKYPAVVLITGSGAHDRDETVFGHKPFLVLADHLTRKGIAVLRVDDRGVGGSTGKKLQATTADFAGDVLAGVAFLKKHKEIDGTKIGLIGHSEGGIVAPLAATQSKDVAFILLLAGTGLTGEEILVSQGKAILEASGASAKDIATQQALQKAMLGAVKEEKDNDKARKLIAKRLGEQIVKLPKDEQKEMQQLVDGPIKAQTELVLTPWFRYFLTYDPAPVLRKVKVPVLALVGEKDVQVVAKPNIKAIEKALKAGGNKDYTVKELAGLNHLFQTCKTGGPAEYGKIEETFAPSALKIISDWIEKRTKSGS